MTSAHPADFAEWPLERRNTFREREAVWPPPPEPDDYGAQAPPGPAEEASPDNKPVALRVVSAAAFDGIPPPVRRWIVPDLIPDRTVTMVSGDGAVGKSTLVLQLAIAVVAEREWIGTLPEPGGVIFLSAEDDEDELHRRIAAIAKAMDVSIADLADLHLIPLAGCDAVLGAPEGKAAIVTPTAVWRGLVEIVATLRPRLVVLDTLADVFAGNENARAEARQFVGMLRGLAIDYDLAVVLIAHPSLSGMASGAGTSGSTGWNNSVRSRLYLETITGDDRREIDADLRVLRVKKANYAPSGLETRVRWRDGCFNVDGPAGGFDKIAAEARAEQVFLDLLAALTAQGRDVSPNKSPTFAPTVFHRHPNANGITKRGFEAAMERLLVSKRIGVETFGPPSRSRNRLVMRGAE